MQDTFGCLVVAENLVLSDPDVPIALKSLYLSREEQYSESTMMWAHYVKQIKKFQLGEQDILVFRK